MKKFFNFLILIASILWFVALLALSINNTFNTDIAPQLNDFFEFAKTYGALVILGAFVFFNTIGKSIIKIIFGILILILLAAVFIFLLQPSWLSSIFPSIA